MYISIWNQEGLREFLEEYSCLSLISSLTDEAQGDKLGYIVHRWLCTTAEKIAGIWLDDKPYTWDHVPCQE
jgi:hypothetical protein